MPVYCYIDLNFDGSRAAYARACEFVEHNNLKYSLSSNVLTELGGREKAGVPDLFAADYDYSQKGRVQIEPQPVCRLVFELYPDQSPLAVENFTALCTGSKGKSKGSGIPLSYQGTKIHRYKEGFVIQGGDLQFGNGTGGESIWGKKFKDDQKGLKLKHDKKGTLSMGNSGKNANSSQFFITLSENTKVCDGKHVVFGHVVHGLAVLDLLEAMAKELELKRSGEEPPFPIEVTSCGTWNPGDLENGFWDADDTFKPIPVAKKDR